MDYAAPARRRARVVGRYLRYAGHPGLLPRGYYVPTYWWDQQRNFGDQLTPALLPSMGVAPVHVQPRYAALVGVGSVIEHLPPDYRGTVWGGGLMFDHRLQLPDATFAAVRGLLSAERLGLSSTVATGDPGLLLRSRACAGDERQYTTLIPHYRHRTDDLWERLRGAFGPRTQQVDVRSRPGVVAARVAESSVVITSSLHGLITADAHGVPAVWTLPRPWGDGGAYKFLDYESNFGRTWERQVPTSTPARAFVDRAAVSDPRRVDELRDGLVDAMGAALANPGWKPYRQSPIVAVKARWPRSEFGSEGNQWPSAPAGVRPRGE